MKNIWIEHAGRRSFMTTAFEMAELAGRSFNVSESVPDTAGEAFLLQEWYEAWLESAGSETAIVKPQQLVVEAADSFQASIPWDQLDGAVVLFSLGGEPLKGTGPIRLYVPNGSSKCLNVKRVVKLRLGDFQGNEVQEAAYGFKHTFSKDDLRINK